MVKKGIISIPQEGSAMQFEFNDKKRSSNKDKHGIDFAEAQALWDGYYG